jgi:hypothetical protein
MAMYFKLNHERHNRALLFIDYNSTSEIFGSELCSAVIVSQPVTVASESSSQDEFCSSLSLCRYQHSRNSVRARRSSPSRLYHTSNLFVEARMSTSMPARLYTYCRSEGLQRHSDFLSLDRRQDALANSVRRDEDHDRYDDYPTCVYSKPDCAQFPEALQTRFIESIQLSMHKLYGRFCQAL